MSHSNTNINFRCTFVNKILPKCFPSTQEFILLIRRKENSLRSGLNSLTTEFTSCFSTASAPVSHAPVPLKGQQPFLTETIHVRHSGDRPRWFYPYITLYKRERYGISISIVCHVLFFKINATKSRTLWMFDPENVKSLCQTDYFVSERALNVSFYSKQNNFAMFYWTD